MSAFGQMQLFAASKTDALQPKLSSLSALPINN